MEKKTKNKILFILFCILSFLLIYYIIGILPKFLSKYEGYSDESVSPSLKIAQTTLKYMIPIIIGHIVLMVSYFVLRAKEYFKYAFVILLLTLAFVIMGIAEIYKGASAGWILMIELLLSIYIAPVLYRFGKKLDNKYIE